MFVCICNSLRVADVNEAAAYGAKDATEVYAFHGCERCCGKCSDEMRRICQRVQTSTYPIAFSDSAAGVSALS